MYKVVMVCEHGYFDMPDVDLGLQEACDRARVYKRRAPRLGFLVVNEDTGVSMYTF